MEYLKKADPKIYSLIVKERRRQEETLMMIPSENITSRAVEEAIGSCFGNKYAEGYPHKRYYQGQKFADKLESLVIERAKKLFNVPFANVQPLSGSPANFAVYNALLKPGDKIMGLALSAGGHLTHGARHNMSSKYFTSIPYHLTKQELIDYGELEKLAQKEKPKIIIAGITAYPRTVDWQRFAKIATDVGAYLLTDISHLAGLIVAGAYPSPVPFADIITTTTHKTLRGPRGAIIMVTKKGLRKNTNLGKLINQSIIPGIQGGPHLNTIAGIGVALKEASSQKFARYGKQIVKNAKALAKELKKGDLDLVSGGTDSHLILIDLRPNRLLGNTVAEAMEEANIILNRNAVPFDNNSPFYPSGIRLGTPGLTSRGMREKEMVKIGRWLAAIINGLTVTKQELAIHDEEEKKKINRQKIIRNTRLIKKVKQAVKRLCHNFPVKLEY